MRPKSRIDKIAVHRQLAHISFADTLLNNARQDNLKGIDGEGEFDPVIIGNGE
jgi:CO dehydrogenase/acetyl-CoA synthase epsilon subunit